jgi:transcriptional regulator with XRE-family HTH domain
VVRKKSNQPSLPFKEVLVAIMKERGLSVQQVGALAGVSKSVAQSWLAGSHPHDLRAVGLLAKALGIGLSELLLGEVEEHTQTQSSGELLDSFERISIFEGLCEINIKKLVPRDQYKKKLQ